MNIFGSVKEIEDIYEKLVEKARLENKNDLESFKNQQEEEINSSNEKNQKFLESTLKIISEDMNNGINFYREQVNESLEHIKNKYKENKKIIIENILKEFGFDFE